MQKPVRNTDMIEALPLLLACRVFLSGLFCSSLSDHLEDVGHQLQVRGVIYKSQVLLPDYNTAYRDEDYPVSVYVCVFDMTRNQTDNTKRFSPYQTLNTSSLQSRALLLIGQSGLMLTQHGRALVLNSRMETF